MFRASSNKTSHPINTTIEHQADSRFGATDLLLLLMTLIWGSNFIVIKYSLKAGEGFLPLSFNGLRFVIAAVVMVIAAIAIVANLKVSRADWWRLFGLGLLANTFYQSLFITGMSYTRAGNAALILATTPLFTAFIGRIRQHEYFTIRAVIGLVLTFTGIVLIVLSGHSGLSFGETIIGDLMLLGATICWSLYTVGSKRLMHVYGSMKTTAIMMITGTPLLLLVCAPSLVRQDWSEVRPIAWAGVVYSALFAIALAYFIWSYGVRKIGSTRTAIYSNITPVIAMLMAWPALGEVPTAGQLIGAVVIFAGLYFVRRGMIAVVPAEALEVEIEEASLEPGKN